MQPMSKRHAAILDTLTSGLTGANPSRTIDNAPGDFMAAVIEKIGPGRFSVAHYFKMNGDPVADPDLEFVRQDGAWYPVAITQITTGYERVAETDHTGRIVSYQRAGYAGLRSFAGVLLTNIKRQQGDLAPKPAAAAKEAAG